MTIESSNFMEIGRVAGDRLQARDTATPRVLFVTTNIWGSDFLLVRALRKGGVEVAMLCPRAHPVRKAQLDCIFDLDPFRSSRSLRAAIDAFAPELLIPGDERALRLMHILHCDGTANERRLVEESLGPPSSYQLMMSRRANMEAAESLGVSVARLVTDSSRASLERHLLTSGYGIVLKADDSWGGNGVRICRDSHELNCAIAELRRRPLVRAFKRWLIDGDAALIVDCFSKRASSLSAQECLPVGRIGDLALFCRNGAVLGLTCAERETGISELGPSTIVRLVERDALAESACRFVRHYGLSGFIGFDFIVDPVTDEARVIEINPRATTLAGVRPRHGSSPAVAAAAELGAIPSQEEASFRQLVAYFPKAWQAHPDDPRLAACEADIPADEPQLVDALLSQDWSSGKRRSRLLRKFRGDSVRSSDGRIALPVSPA